MSFVYSNLGDWCSKVLTGGTPLTSKSEYYEGGTIPWLKTKEVNFSRIYSTEFHITEKGLINSSAKMVPENSVIVAMYGQGNTAGRVAINKIPVTTNQACCNLVFNEGKADYRFVYYALKNSYKELVSMKNGGAQPNLNTKLIKNLKIPTPRLEIQRRIADILSAYDDLIENNRKQLKLFEESAMRLYNKWFVALRFPEYENMEEKNGLPKGWKECVLSDVVHFDPKINLNKGEKKKFIPMSALNLNSMTVNESEFTEVTNNAGRKFQNGDTLLARITPSLENGKTAFVYFLEPEEKAVGSTEFIVMRSKRLNPYMVYCLARSEWFRNIAIQSMTGATGRQRVQKDVIKTEKYLLPPDDIISAFEKFTSPMFNQVKILMKQIILLRQARDKLLPKLMNGEIEV